MSNPSVFCMMLTAARQAFAERAVRCFLRQTYEKRRLLIYDTGGIPFDLSLDDSRITLIRTAGNLENIGQARNRAMTWATSHDDIVCHWDDDDWSAPERIANQVKLLQESGADAVGYREMLFWRNLQLSERDVYGPSGTNKPCDVLQEAWLYRNTDPRYIISTSLCYWRKTWDRVHFAETQVREWRPWFDGRLKTEGAHSSLCRPPKGLEDVDLGCHVGLGTAPSSCEWPAMISEIHGGNTCAHESLNPQGVNRDGSPAWERVPGWDQTVRQILESA